MPLKFRSFDTVLASIPGWHFAQSAWMTCGSWTKRARTSTGRAARTGARAPAFSRWHFVQAAASTTAVSRFFCRSSSESVAVVVTSASEASWARASASARMISRRSASRSAARGGATPWSRSFISSLQRSSEAWRWSRTLESGRALLQGGPVEGGEGSGGGQPPLEGGDARLDARALAGERLRIALRANLVQVEQHPGIAVADGRARDLAAARFELFRPEHGSGADPA